MGLFDWVPTVGEVFSKVYWKVLHLTRLAGPYGRTMCKLGLYRKFALNGRCMWCGNVHSKEKDKK